MTTEPLSIVVDGQTFTAERRISGQRKLRQVVVFMGHEEHDSQTYTPAQAGAMRATAELILWQLVTKGWPGRSALAPPARPD